MRSIFKVCHVTKNVFKSKLKSQRLMSGVAAINEVKVFRDNQEVVERMKVREITRLERDTRKEPQRFRVEWRRKGEWRRA